MYRLLLSDLILLFYQDGLTALMRAVQSGDTEAVDVLVKAGADVNLQENVSEPVYSQHSNHLCEVLSIPSEEVFTTNKTLQ